MKSDGFEKLLVFLQKLEQQEIGYTLAHHRDEAMMVTVAVPGERWEVEFFNDGSVELERFISNGEIGGENDISALFARYSEQETLTSGSLVY